MDIESSSANAHARGERMCSCGGSESGLGSQCNCVATSTPDDTVELVGRSWRKCKVRDIGNLSQCLCESSMSPTGDEVAGIQYCQEQVSNG